VLSLWFQVDPKLQMLNCQLKSQVQSPREMCRPIHSTGIRLTLSQRSSHTDSSANSSTYFLRRSSSSLLNCFLFLLVVHSVSNSFVSVRLLLTCVSSTCLLRRRSSGYLHLQVAVLAISIPLDSVRFLWTCAFNWTRLLLI
jgi:hypothetical protein